MRKDSDKSHHLLNHFDTWLKDTPVTPDEGFLASLRARMDRPQVDLDEAIDTLLRPDHRLRDPHMAAKVRQRLEQRPPARSSAPWFQWLSPLAAAAVLSLAFVSFQMQAPDSPPPLAVNSTPPPSFSSVTEPDSDLTQIFALAANLHGPSDVSSLQSVDNLAYLFE